jgi:hypothetical protein
MLENCFIIYWCLFLPVQNNISGLDPIVSISHPLDIDFSITFLNANLKGLSPQCILLDLHTVLCCLPI